jgi:hypothetical protein
MECVFEPPHMYSIIGEGEIPIFSLDQSAYIKPSSLPLLDPGGLAPPALSASLIGAISHYRRRNLPPYQI